MPRYAVIQTYEYTKTCFVNAASADEARDIANGPSTPENEWVDCDAHNLIDEIVQEEE